MPTDETGGGSFDIKAALSEFRSASTASSNAASAPLVPLWKTVPSQPKITRRGGRDAADIEGITPTRVMSGAAFGTDDIVSGDAAEAHWLDMEETDKVEFFKLAQRAGLVSKKNVSPVDLASAWGKAVQAARSYNAQQTDKNKWVSPWEAVTKLAAQTAAGLGGFYDGEAGQGGTTTNTRMNRKTFTADDLRSAAEEIAADLLGRAPNSTEMAQIVARVQRAYDANPETVTTTTTTDELGNSASVSEQSGGVDATPHILDQTRSNPETARAQAAIQYLPALMQALSAPV